MKTRFVISKMKHMDNGQIQDSTIMRLLNVVYENNAHLNEPLSG